MDLNALIKQKINSAFSTIDALLKDVVYTSITVGAYDSATDTTSDVTTTKMFRALEYKLNDREKDTLYPAGAETGYEYRKLLVNGTDLDGIRPRMEDKLTVGGTPYEIIRINTVPGESVWILFISRAS
jgi:hypothetical protein